MHRNNRSRHQYDQELMLLIIEEAFLVQTGIEFSRASLEKMIVRLRLSLPVSDTPRQFRHDSGCVLVLICRRLGRTNNWGGVRFHGERKRFPLFDRRLMMLHCPTLSLVLIPTALLPKKRNITLIRSRV